MELTASMRPRPLSRGNVDCVRPVGCISRCFNEAAAVKPRKRSGPARSFARPQRFNEAAAVKPRKPIAG